MRLRGNPVFVPKSGQGTNMGFPLRDREGNNAGRGGWGFGKLSELIRSHSYHSHNLY